MLQIPWPKLNENFIHFNLNSYQHSSLSIQPQFTDWYICLTSGEPHVGYGMTGLWLCFDKIQIHLIKLNLQTLKFQSRQLNTHFHFQKIWKLTMLLTASKTFLIYISYSLTLLENKNIACINLTNIFPSFYSFLCSVWLKVNISHFFKILLNIS